MGRERKTSKGKQKIEIKKIEAENARQVCFSKRKYGVFSKANELATLCGAKVAILIESPAGCPYTFGSPSVAHVTDMFLRDDGTGITEVDVNEDQRLEKVQRLNNNLMDVGSNLQESRKKKALLINRITELYEQSEDVRRIENVADLNLAELTKTKETLERFKESIKSKMMKETTANSAVTIFSELGSRVNNVGSSHDKGKALALPPELGLKVNNVDPSPEKGNVAISLELGSKVNNVHPSPEEGKGTLAISPEVGSKVNNVGLSHGKGKGIDLDLNLFPDESFDHVQDPCSTHDENVASPSEPHRVPDDNRASYSILDVLNLLGGRGNFAAKESK